MDDDFSSAFKALGHPHRLALIQRLLAQAHRCCTTDQEQDCTLDSSCCNFGDLVEELDVSKSTVSHHLKELAQAGLIERIRDGRHLYCRVNTERLDTLRQFLDVRRPTLSTFSL